MNYTWQWDFVWKILPRLIEKGVLLTVELTTLAIVVGTVIGLAVALVRLSHIRPVRWLASAYVDFFRGTPAADPDHDHSLCPAGGFRLYPE